MATNNIFGFGQKEFVGRGPLNNISDFFIQNICPLQVKRNRATAIATKVHKQQQ